MVIHYKQVISEFVMKTITLLTIIMAFISGFLIGSELAKEGVFKNMKRLGLRFESNLILNRGDFYDRFKRYTDDWQREFAIYGHSLQPKR